MNFRVEEEIMYRMVKRDPRDEKSQRSQRPIVLFGTIDRETCLGARPMPVPHSLVQALLNGVSQRHVAGVTDSVFANAFGNHLLGPQVQTDGLGLFEVHEQDHDKGEDLLSFSQIT